MDPIAIGQGPIQGFQNHNPHPFADHNAIGAVVKGFAGSRGRQHSHLAQQQVQPRRGQHAHPTRDRQVAMALLDTFAGGMHRN